MAETSHNMGLEATQSPPIQSGFNNTKHNCNIGRQRPKKPYCGNYTLIGFREGTFAHYRFRCKSYACGCCGPKKIRQVRKRIVQHAMKHGLQRFLTLTLDPNKLTHGWSTQEKIVYLYDVWRKMRVYLRRKLCQTLVFIAVVELQRNGNPHLHLLVGSYIPKRWISTSWQALGGGWATRIEYADMHRVAAYLSKYLTDDSLQGLPTGTRRFSTSRGLALFQRTPSDRTWILVQAPIEYWRNRALDVSAEHYEAAPHGKALLISFVAGRAAAFLASRLQVSNATRLSIEARRKPRRDNRFGANGSKQ